MNLDTNTRAQRLQALRQRIATTAEACGRQPAEVTLLAVSKRKPPGLLPNWPTAAFKAFGENYLQEALPKIKSLADRPIEWHFIGRIQANKTRLIAANFAWVHTLARSRIAERLNAQRPAAMPPLNVCIEVNVSGETSKDGVAPQDVLTLAEAVRQLPGLNLRGLMALPAPLQDPAAQRRAFRPLTEVYTDLKIRGFALDTLSMGTSHDFEAAIAEGANLIRIGTALFGPRDG